VAPVDSRLPQLRVTHQLLDARKYSVSYRIIVEMLRLFNLVGHSSSTGWLHDIMANQLETWLLTENAALDKFEWYSTNYATGSTTSGLTSVEQDTSQTLTFVCFGLVNHVISIVTKLVNECEFQLPNKFKCEYRFMGP